MTEELRKKFAFVLVVLGIKLTLNLFYIQFSEYFDYYGIVLLERQTHQVLLVWILLVISAWMVPVKDSRVSHALHSFLFIFTFVPASVYAELNAGIDLNYYLGLSTVFIVTPIISRFFSASAKVRLPSLNKQSFGVVLGLLIIIVLAFLFNSFGLPTRIPTVDSIYEQRETFHNSAGRLDKYFFDWTVNSLNVVLLILALMRKNLLVFVASFLLTVYLFSLGGHKGALLLWPFTLFIFFLVQSSRENFVIFFAMLILVGLNSFLIIDTLLDLNYSMASTLLVRRGLLLPSQIYYHYCEFFSENQLNYFSQNIPFKLFISSPYDQNIAEIIGETYFTNREGVYANGNVFADTFANIGYWSYPILSIVLAGLYSVVDWVGEQKNQILSITLILISAHVLINTGLIVTMVTHGFILSLLVLIISPKRIRNIQRS